MHNLNRGGYTRALHSVNAKLSAYIILDESVWAQIRRRST